jgi:hypothetical protein
VTSIFFLALGIFGFILWADDEGEATFRHLGFWLLLISVLGLAVGGLTA